MYPSGWTCLSTHSSIRFLAPPSTFFVHVFRVLCSTPCDSIQRFSAFFFLLRGWVSSPSRWHRPSCCNSRSDTSCTVFLGFIFEFCAFGVLIIVSYSSAFLHFGVGGKSSASSTSVREVLLGGVTVKGTMHPMCRRSSFLSWIWVGCCCSRFLECVSRLTLKDLATRVLIVVFGSSLGLF